MPANKKYLTNSLSTKISKICAALIGGMIASISFHLALALWFNPNYILPTSLFSNFILWTFFMILVYWIKNPWKSWGILLFVIATSTAAIFLAKN
ncbi:hypothetical protein [Aquimarina sediminis]|uniref:hypothetical protein n=1 Tax=Aquimarina sediminis TaxID=2070536 RepID=UPI000CA05BA7|nr:hypothetical protein [Aquimarina sediminis]